jgi:small-conductance mechanosensitive channel
MTAMNQQDLVRWALAAALALGVWLLGWLSGRVVLGAAARIVRRTPTDLDEMLLAAMRPHVPVWSLLLGVLVAVRYGALPPAMRAIVDRAALAVFLMSLTLVLAAFLTRVVERHAKQWPHALPATALTQSAVRIVVIGLGVLVVLGNLGIAIAPILTALGVGSLAVALALQPTLTNLFAGVHITLARQIRVGDFVELETGQQGYIADIGWRSTQIRELPNNLVVVPNSRLAEIIVKNYALPETEQAALVKVGVAYGSDLDTVERVTVETARDVQRTVTGADPMFEPFIRFNTFGESSIDLTVILRVRTFVDRYLVIHEFVKRLQRSYDRAGIEIPFPQRVVHLPTRDSTEP